MIAAKAVRRAATEHVVTVIRLALGLEVRRAIPDDEWALLYEIALRERVAPLVWLRSGPWIRSAAPASVVTLWRSSVLASMDRTGRVLDATHDCVAALRAANVGAIVLKGAPLGQSLYDEPLARPIDDIDLFIPAGERRIARWRLMATGWTHVAGEAPWHESFERDNGREIIVLELHSQL
ncbi:MAG: nucleotidyltransferase family protein, partial [Gemmatimonadota bacterium]|nr:nucleotidyltransferase family protein [Gemmatimonadota bacterium]